MTGYKPGTSGVGSDYSTNWARTTAPGTCVVGSFFSVFSFLINFVGHLRNLWGMNPLLEFEIRINGEIRRKQKEQLHHHHHWSISIWTFSFQTFLWGKFFLLSFFLSFFLSDYVKGHSMCQTVIVVVIGWNHLILQALIKSSQLILFIEIVVYT